MIIRHLFNFLTIMAAFTIFGCASAPLNYPAKWGDLPKVKHLIAEGADVNAKDKNGATALMLASLQGHREIGELLVAKGADVNLKANDGRTALMFASLREHREIGELREPGVMMPPVSLEGHRELVELLVAKGADVNAKDKNGATALMFASERGHREIVQVLLNKGADVNAKAIDGKTAVMYAYAYRHMEIVQILIDKGANFSAKDNKDGVTALMVATANGRTEIVRALIDKGADVNAKAIDGGTALMDASQIGHKEIAQVLIDKGADVNAKNNKGGTALMYASYAGHLEIVQVLIHKGANVNAESIDGETVLMSATANGRTEIVQALIDKGADVNAKDKKGATALMLASQKGYKEIVQLLITKGADVNAKIIEHVDAHIKWASGAIAYKGATLSDDEFASFASKDPGAVLYRSEDHIITALSLTSNQEIKALLIRAGANRALPYKVTASIAPGGTTFWTSPNGMIHVDRMRLSNGEMFLMAPNGCRMAIKSGMSMNEFEQAAKTQQIKIVKVTSRAYSVCASNVYFENDRLVEVENPDGDRDRPSAIRIPRQDKSCEENCTSQYNDGEFKAGVTVEDCINATCK